MVLCGRVLQGARESEVDFRHSSLCLAFGSAILVRDGRLPNFRQSAGGELLQPLRKQSREHISAGELFEGLGHFREVQLQFPFLRED